VVISAINGTAGIGQNRPGRALGHTMPQVGSADGQLYVNLRSQNHPEKGPAVARGAGDRASRRRACYMTSPTGRLADLQCLNGSAGLT